MINLRYIGSNKTKLILAAGVIVALVLAVLPVPTAYAAVCTSTGSGNWSSAATWSCGHVPTSSDDVMIANGHTVTLDVPATVNSVTINDGNAATSSLTIGGTNALTVTYDVNVINTNNATTKSVDVGAGSLNIGGNLYLSAGAGTRVAQLTISTGTVTVNGNINATVANAKIIFSGAGTLNIGGTYTNGGTLTAGTGTVNFTSAAQTVGSYNYYSLGLSGSGTKTLQAGTTTVGGNLTLSGTASAATAANLTVSGSLNIGSGTSLTISPNFTLTVTGTSTIAGSLTLAGTGAKSFTGDVTIPGGGVWNETGAATITYSGSLTDNGTYTASTGTHTFNGTTKTIGGTDILSIPTAIFTGAYTNTGSMTVGTLTVNGLAIRLTNNGTITASTSLAGSGGLTQGAGAILNLGGTTSITTLTATASGNSVNYTGAAQAVKATAYDYLVLSGSGVKTLAAGTSVNTDLNIIHAGGASASIAAGQTLAVNSLGFDGTGQVSGTWGGTGSGAAHINSIYFAATTGKLNVATTDTRTVPVITFGPAPTPTYLGGNFTVSATTTNTDSSALTYSVVSGPCALVGGATFSSSGAGTCVVQAFGAATAHFEAASATQSITIAKASQATLTVAASPSTVVQGSNSTLSSSGGSGTGAVTYSVGSSTGCTVAGNILTVTDASGTCSVTATNAGDANYLPITSSPLTITMAPYQAEINKNFSPISIQPGDVSQLSIMIYNANAFQLINAAWSDNLVGVQPGMTLASPIGLTNTCGGTVSAVSGGTTISLSGGTVPAKVGSTNGSCTVTVNVTSTTAGNLIDTIPAGILSATDSSGKLVSNTTPASATLSVATVLAPTVNKNFNANTIWAGDKSLLTINILNQDPSNALTQVSLTDVLPTNVVVSSIVFSPALTNCGGSASLTATPGTASIVLSNATIAAGVGTTCTIKVNVTSAVQGAYIDTIPGGAIQTYQGVTNALQAQATLNVQQLNLTKAFAPAAIAAGGTSTATITLQNPTSVDYTNVSLTDSLPAGMTVTGTPATTCGGSAAYNSGSNQVTLTGGTLPHSTTPPTPKTCTLTFTVTVPVTTGTSTLTNTIPAGSLHDDQNVSNPTTVSANLTVTGALTLTKAIAPSSITVGNPATVTITLQNSTGTPITGVQMTDTLPANLTVYGTPGALQCSGTVSYTATTVTLSGGTIPKSNTPPSPAGTCTVVFQVTSTVAGTYVNTIPAGGVTGFQGLQGLSNGSAVSSNNLTVQASTLPITGSKSFNPANILPGANTDLTINVIAPVDTSLTGVSVTDVLPAGMTISNSTPASKNAACSGGSLSAVTGAGTTSWTGGSIAAGATCTIQVYVTSATVGSVTNTITPAQVTDNEGRSLTSAISASLNVSNFQVSKAFYPTSINPNGSSTLTITLTNPNIIALSSVSLTDSLATMGASPNNVVVAPVPNASTSCGGTLTAAAGSSSITLTGGIVPAQVGGIPGICTINVNVEGLGAAGARTDTIPIANVSASLAGVSVSPLAAATATLTVTSLTITVNKSFDTPTVFGGSASTLRIRLTNPNTALLTGIAFADTMPSGMFIAAPANLNTGTCGGTLVGTPGSGTFSYSGGSLAASTSCDLTLSATMNVNGNLTNIIPIGAVTTFNGASNPAAAQASLTNLGGVSVSKFFSPNPIALGASSTLTLTVLNTSSFTLTNMGLVDTLPAGLSIAASPSPVNNCGGALTAAAGTQTISLATGSVPATSSCTITVPVTGSVAGSYVNTIPINTLTDNQGQSNTEAATDTLKILGFPTLVTTPTPGGVVGIRLNDSASLSGGVSPTGPVTFNLYAPSDATCSGTPIDTETSASAPYGTSTGFVTNAAGTWHWTASYSGDANNSPATSPCSAEPVAISPAIPSLTTSASPSTGTVGTAITAGDSVTSMGGAFNPTGSVTFTLYSDAGCSSPVLGMSGSGTVSGGLASWSTSWTPLAAGIYYWLASYPGDANNTAATSSCGAANEGIVIGKATPLLTTNAAGSVAVGSAINDVAALSGGYGTLTGSIGFSVFAPGDTTCASPIPVNPPSAVNGAGYYTSGNYTISVLGDYHWIAQYSGDVNNNAVSTSCNDAGETSTAVKATPNLTTTASGPVAVGATITDTAHLSGGYGTLGGTLSFDVYAPGDTTCSAPIAVNPAVGVNGVGDYISSTYAANAAGSYRWQAFYSGDADNNAVNTSCNDAGETAVVNPTSPAISTTLSAPSTSAGGSVFDSSVLSGASGNAGGSVSYTVYSDSNCTLGAQSAGVVTVTNGNVPNSNPVTFNTPGDYYWQAVYSGDSNNQGATSSCLSEHLTVIPPTPTSTPTSTVTFTASPTETYTPTATETFTPSPTETYSPTATATFTSSPTETYTPTATETFTSSPTETYTPTDTETATLSPTETYTSTATETFTSSPTETYTPTATETFTSSPTETYTPTATETFTSSPTETYTPTDTETATLSPTETYTLTATETFTSSPTETYTPTATETFTPSPTETYTPTATETSTPSPTETYTPTDTNTLTDTDTFTPSPTDTYTPTPTNTYTPTDTATFTTTPSDTYTPTYTPTPSETTTDTFTPTATATYTQTPSVTPSDTYTSTDTAIVTQTPLNTLTDTPTQTDTATYTQTPSETSTYTFTPSDTATYTQTSTDTFTPTFTPTFTSSPTDTYTPTDTATYTTTPTASSTPPLTPTFIPTPSTTPTVTFPPSDLTKILLPGGDDPSVMVNPQVVTIGEVVTYEVDIQVPASSTLTGASLTDVLDEGLTFVNCVSIAPDDPAILSTDVPGGFAAVCSNPAVSGVGADPSDPGYSGRQVVFNLGTITNSDPASDHVLKVRYQAGVLDIASVVSGVHLTNHVQWSWNGGSLSATAQTLSVVEPHLALSKSVSLTTAKPGTILTYTIIVSYAGTGSSAYDVLLTDPVPSGLSYQSGTWRCLSGQLPVLDDSNPTNLIASWAAFANTGTPTILEYKVQLGDLPGGTRLMNTATIDWSSLPGDFSHPRSIYNTHSTERYYDPSSAVNVYGVSGSATVTVYLAAAATLPQTGFAPHRRTVLTQQTVRYAELGDLWLEIPRLGVQIPIVGVPQSSDGSWDVSWLIGEAGWLQGSAFPTWNGNSVLTGHVYDASGQPGPFVHLNQLIYGDPVIVHAWGMQYKYEVQAVLQVSPDDIKAMMKHEASPWLTLVTCRGYDESSGNYLYRILVRAVLVAISP